MKKRLQVLKSVTGSRIPSDACIQLSESKAGNPATLDIHSEGLQMGENVGRQLVHRVTSALMTCSSGSNFNATWAFKRATARTLLFRM